ncbi:MAG TPA: lamin tail domain-containing protein, partial [Gemmatimonadaceae bacterium]|nr:lamin tail domain-containing protein [Gemmatimonadaceae bacterium]
MNVIARGSLSALAILSALAAACTRPEARAEHTAGGAVGTGTDAPARHAPARDTPARVVIHELMADPAAVPDERGEWAELRNLGAEPVELRGWRLRSGNDRDFAIPTSLVVPPGGYAVLARDGDPSRNGGVRASLAYGGALSLANGSDWLALVTPEGATVDSVAWTRAPRGTAVGVRDAGLPHPNVGDANWVQQTSSYGAGDRGTPGAANDGAVSPTLGAPVAPAGPAAPVAPSTPATPATPRTPGTPAPLTVRVLDVGQG